MKRLLVFTLAAIFAVGGSLITVQQSNASELSEKGRAGVAQLAACLQTAESLEIVYVIDNSGSLLETDNSMVRAQILMNDLERWAEIRRSRPALAIAYSAIRFATGSKTLVGKTNLNPDAKVATGQAKQLASAVRDLTPAGWTDWGAGIKAAADMLKSSKADCKTIIWFTDGGLNVDGFSKPKNFDAIESLCGSAISGAELPSSPTNDGLIQNLRNAGVHLFGISLNDPNHPEHPEKFGAPKWDTGYWRSFMQSIAEGDGSNLAKSKKDGGLPSGPFVCGMNSDVEGSEYAHGAFLEAQSAAEVALAFITLSAVAQNGTVKQCEIDGTFWVDPGIASVQIINNDFARNPNTQWEIRNAADEVMATSADSGNPAGSSKRIAANVTEPEKWRVSGVSCDVIAFTELHPVLDQKTIFSGKPARITGSFIRDNQRGEANIDLYTSIKMSVAMDGEALSPSEVSFEPASGAFNIAVKGPTAGTTHLAIDLDLQTEHWDLDTLSFDIAKEVMDATVLPTIEPFVPDGTLDSAADTLVLTSTVRPPAAGGEGQVCFAPTKQIKVVTDNQHEIGAAMSRADSWKFIWTGLQGNCVSVSDSTGPVKVSLGVSNSVPRNSSVTVVVDYSLKAADTDALPDSQAIEFESYKQHDWTKFGLIFLAVFLGGILIPLLMLYVLNRVTAKLIRGNNLMYGTFEVVYSLEDGSIKSANEVPLNSGKIGLESFKFLPPSTNSTTADAPGLGQLSAVVPLMPLTEPWFEIEAAAGTRVFNAVSPHRASPKEFETGQKALFSGDVGNFWAITFAESALSDAAKSGAEVRGKLHVYMRNADPNFTETLVGILAQPRFNQRVVAATKMHAVAAAHKSGNGSPMKQTTSRGPNDPPPPVVKPSVGQPPRPGSSPATKLTTLPINPTGISGPALTPTDPNPGGATPPPPPPPPAAR